jgi:hypothetical protein
MCSKCRFPSNPNPSTLKALKTGYSCNRFLGSQLSEPALVWRPTATKFQNLGRAHRSQNCAARGLRATSPLKPTPKPARHHIKDTIVSYHALQRLKGRRPAVPQPFPGTSNTRPPFRKCLPQRFFSGGPPIRALGGTRGRELDVPK